MEVGSKVGPNRRKMEGGAKKAISGMVLRSLSDFIESILLCDIHSFVHSR